MILALEELHTDEDGPAFVFQCRTGKGRTTTAMAIAGLVICHKKVTKSRYRDVDGDTSILLCGGGMKI